MAAANNRQPAGIPIHNTRFVRFVMPSALTICVKGSRSSAFQYNRILSQSNPRDHGPDVRGHEPARNRDVLTKRKPTGRRSKAVYLKKSGTFRGNRVHTLTGSAPILYNKRENPGPGLKAGLLRYTMGGWARSKWQDGVGMAVKRSKKSRRRRKILVGVLSVGLCLGLVLVTVGIVTVLRRAPGPGPAGSADESAPGTVSAAPTEPPGPVPVATATVGSSGDILIHKPGRISRRRYRCGG